MKMQANIFILVAALLFMQACEKSILDNCAKNTGRIIIENRGEPHIDYIHISDNVNLILKQGNAGSLRVEAGENIISSIVTEVNEGRLYIRNENKCNWLRSYNKDINVYLSVADLDSLDYFGSGTISSENAISGDSVQISVWEGSGSIEMELDVEKSRLNLHYGTVDFNIRGRSGVTYIYAASYGPFYCEQLNSKFVYINNRGTNNCYVRASVELGATIEYLGNIYYYGNPPVVHSNISGEGELISMGE